MSEKSRELWQITAIVAINLVLLIIISSVSHAEAMCLGCSGEKVAAIQKVLHKKGFYDGKINGEYDPATRKAVKNFQISRGIPDSGETDYETVEALNLNARSGECFAVETELLARYLKLCGGATYPEMLFAAENILSGMNGNTLSDAIFENSNIPCKTWLTAEPSSQSYSAALHVLGNR